MSTRKLRSMSDDGLKKELEKQKKEFEKLKKKFESQKCILENELNRRKERLMKGKDKETASGEGKQGKQQRPVKGTLDLYSADPEPAQTVVPRRRPPPPLSPSPTPHAMAADYSASEDLWSMEGQKQYRAQEGKTVAFVDKDETQSISYPSSDDPDCVDVSLTDLRCLNPGGHLNSNIMNFYIRHLTLKAIQRKQAVPDFLCCNTFFYPKLIEVAFDRVDKKTAFKNFRGWWKSRGVTIFEKPYILMPINDENHWSLAVICIPETEYKSGAVILHLDSLGLHSSRDVCSNIKSYLMQEWEYMKEEIAHPHLMELGIWQNYRHRIDTISIQVPQQENGSDSGLFVLLFMERFIEQFPGRLKRTDFDRFGKEWFAPEEASGLRGEIQNLLKSEFQKARQ